MKSFSIVVAMDEKNGIGKRGALAWHLAADLKFFRKITTETTDPLKTNAVIMGRKTWDALPENLKPLPRRLNVVLSHSSKIFVAGETLLFSSLEDALNDLEKKEKVESIFVIGGAQIYQRAMTHPDCHTLFVTHLKGDFGCDAFFPSIPAIFKLIKSCSWCHEGELSYRFCEYRKLV